MEELNRHLHQLPDFLQTELVAKSGSSRNPVQMIDSYWAATNEMIAAKQASLRQEHIEYANLFFGDIRPTKDHLEKIQYLRTLPGKQDLGFEASYLLGSIRLLNEFKTGIESLGARLKEQERQHAHRRAEEAAHLQAEAAARARAQAQEAARLQAEAAARQRAQAEDTARRLAEEQAAQRRAKEEALQLAQRQVEEAALALAQRQAEEKLAIKERGVTHPVGLTAGPEIRNALRKLQSAIEGAVAEFAAVIDGYDLSEQQFATLHALEAVH